MAEAAADVADVAAAVALAAAEVALVAAAVWLALALVALVVAETAAACASAVTVAMLIYVVDVVSALVISPMSRTRPEPVCPVIDTREAAALDALCEFGQTDLAARRLNTNVKAIENYLYKAMSVNGYPNRLTLVLARDRENRAKEQT